jgi:hypothetical protein
VLLCTKAFNITPTISYLHSALKQTFELYSGDPGKKTVFLSHLYLKRSFYQDRLGTNIGKALKNETVLLRRSCDCDRLVARCHRNRGVGSVPTPGNIYVTPLTFKLGGRPVLSAHLNVKTAGSEPKRPEI